MKKTSFLIVLLFLLSCFNVYADEPAGEKEIGLSVEANLAVNSKYLWRGIELNEDPVFQPEVKLGFKGFSATVWGNMELTSVHNGHEEDGDSGDFTEIDYIFDYSGGFKKFNYSLGYIYYDFPHTSISDTNEIYAGLGYDCLLSPKLTVYRDLRDNDGFYFTLDVSHDFKLERLFNSTLTTGATVGFATKRFTKSYYEVHENTFTDVLLSAELSIPVNKYMAVVPSMHYSGLLDQSIRDADIADKDDNLWFGINLAFTFDL